MLVTGKGGEQQIRGLDDTAAEIHSCTAMLTSMLGPSGNLLPSALQLNPGLGRTMRQPLPPPAAIALAGPHAGGWVPASLSAASADKASAVTRCSQARQRPAAAAGAAASGGLPPPPGCTTAAGGLPDACRCASPGSAPGVTSYPSAEGDPLLPQWRPWDRTPAAAAMPLACCAPSTSSHSLQAGRHAGGRRGVRADVLQH